MDADDSGRSEQFLFVSRLLLETETLDERLAAVYLAMLDDLDPAWPLAPMAAAFGPFASLPPLEREAKIVAQLQLEPAWHDAAANLLKLWFSGQLAAADSTPDNPTYVPGPPAAFINALVWGLADTRAQGVPGPFFGEWAYPPAREETSVAPPWGGP